MPTPLLLVLTTSLLVLEGGAGFGSPAGMLQQVVPPPPPPPPAVDTATTTLGSSPLSDLAVRFGARGEFGGDWTLFRPCDASFQLTCRPGLVPQLQPDVQFGLAARGSIADRIFVDVDYDQTREFAGSNLFQVYYQGLAGESLQRLEVGDISFALPDTRFLTRGIPVGNFGVLARGEFEGLEVQTVFAQQRGARRTREFRLGGIGTETGVIYRDTLVLDDAEYVKGQFFFLVDPARITGAPHLDVLALRPGDAPPDLAPGAPPIQLYRMERDPVLRQQVEGYIQADALASGPEGVIGESGWFRYLRPGEDYYLHPSGLWVALRVPLRPGDALAVTYIAQTGEPVGDYNPEALLNIGQIPTLRLIRSTQPQHQPGRPTWDMEMKQVYRVSGSDDVDRFSLEVSVSLGEESAGHTFRTTADGRPISFLRLFGLDEHAPAEQVDRAAVFQPAEEAWEGAGIQGTFLVFPTLRPFLDPPPVRSEGLTAGQVAQLLGPDRNLRIYEALDPFERNGGGLYRVNLSAEIRSSGVASVFPLGSFGLRPGSERIFLGDRRLRPLMDYVVDYELGVVTLLQPEALLARAPSGLLRVSWEEAAVFQVAPTSVLGMSAHVPLADRGGLDLIGLYQIENEIVNRPRFGAEPGALGLLGGRASFALDVPRFDRALERVFGDRASEPSELRIETELALSIPDPNRSGDAFLDDFDSGDERVVSLLSHAWHLGSRPAFRDGAGDRLPSILDEASIGSLVWQHNWIERDAQGDSVGTFEGFFPAEIDRQINVAGTQTREAGLRLTFGQGQPGAFQDPLWRSFTTLLSPTGLDLTYTEYLDFYAAEGEALTLVIDLGMVSEDAFFVDSQGRTSGIHPETGRSWGLGVLDQEADPLRGEVWSPEADARGVWVESCVAEPGRVYTLGDPRANCTRGNARRDTEDLNGNGVLDSTERYVRYVVHLDGSSPYLSRNRSATGTGFRLYRIPIRGPHAIAPTGAFDDADWRAVQFMRITVAGPRNQSLTLARMRLVGSRWVKRGVDGVLSGIGGDIQPLGGRLEVSPVSVLTEGSAYQAPPGVLEQLDDPTSAVSGRGVEFNEKSLGLRYDDLGGGDRAEVYLRFLQRPRNFLSYGQVRLWVVARESDAGPDGATDFFLKVGSDPDNFYLYRAPLHPVVNPAGVRPQDWLPERVVDFNEWTVLRRRAEQRLMEESRAPGDPPVMVWSADSTYAVVLTDRARAPNLAAVREISMGVWNRAGLPTTGEVWINELRLAAGVRTPGIARHLNIELDGADLFQGRLGYSGQGAYFQQLAELPTHQGDDAISLSGTLQLGAMLPEPWGWDLPLTVSHLTSARDPLFLEGTDVRAAELPGVRTVGASESRVSVAFRPEGRTGSGAADLVLAGLDARLDLTRASASSLTTRSRASAVVGAVGYTWRPEARTVPLIPGFLDPIARIFIPGALLHRLREVDLRWTPEEIGARAGLRRRILTIDRFDRIFVTPDEVAGRTSAPERWLEQGSRIAFRPLEGMSVSLDMRTTRDLLEPESGVRDPRVRGAVEDERRWILGRGIGWETRREIVGRVAFQPALPPWIRADLGIQTRYVGERDPGLVRFASAPDSTAFLLRDAGGARDLRASFTLDPDALVRGVLAPGPAADEVGGVGATLRALGRTLSPINLSVQDGITSRFHREEVAPGGHFQLGLGGVDRFETLDDVTATSLVFRRGFSSGSGLRLPGTVFVNVNHQTTRTENLDRRSDRESRVSTWPDLRAGVGELPLPEGWREAVERLSMSVGLQRTRQEVSYGGDLQLQHRTREDHRVPMELALEWVGGFVTRYRGQIGWGEGRDPTGVTERALTDHGFSLETRLVPRTGLAGQGGEPLRLSLMLEYVSVVECRVVTGQAACVDFIDQVNRAISFAADTWVSGMEVGGQVSLVDRRSYTGLHSGFTQFQLGIWGRMLFEAGPLARLGEPRELF